MQGKVSAGAADYVRVDSLEAAIATLAKGPRTILAGGTDVFPRLQDRPLTGAILDISGIAALGAVAFDGVYWRIGAAAVELSWPLQRGEASVSARLSTDLAMGG